AVGPPFGSLTAIGGHAATVIGGNRSVGACCLARNIIIREPAAGAARMGGYEHAALGLFPAGISPLGANWTRIAAVAHREDEFRSCLDNVIKRDPDFAA